MAVLSISTQQKEEDEAHLENMYIIMLFNAMATFFYYIPHYSGKSSRMA
jgi:hypothetical protein